FNQYLLLTEEPVLFHTGSAQQAAALLPRLEAALAGRPLRHIFVSHFESDECGGLAALLDRYPDASVICPEVTARQLMGFGYQCSLDAKKPGEHIVTDSFDLEFIGYPSEMHLWEGLLAYEHRRKIFFSSDLMMRWGETGSDLVHSSWKDEVGGITAEQVPSPQGRLRLQEDLMRFSPELIATGHGPVVDLS
ncbi:MBL fold metallo-hydrolase, partial [Escherichia coli]